MTPESVPTACPTVAPPPLQARRSALTPLVCWLSVLVVMGSLAALLFAFDPSRHGFYPRCMFNRVTGLSCPGCGGLRATHQLLHGHFREALALNPLIVLFLLVPGWALLLAGWRKTTGRELKHPFRHRGWVWAFVILVLVFGIVRNLPIPGWISLSTQGKEHHVQNHWR